MTKRHDLYGLHFASVLLGGTALFSKLIPLSALDITAFRGAVAAVILAALIIASRKSFRLPLLAQYGAMGIGGVIFAIHWMTFFYSIQISSVAVGIIGLFTFPVITAVLEPLLDLRRPTGRTLATGGVVLLGVFLIGMEGGIRGDVVAGLSLAIFSAFLYAVRNILQRRRLQGVTGTQLMFYQSTITALVFIPFMRVGLGEISLYSWLLLLLLGSVFTALPHSMLAHGLRTISATSASFIMSLQVFYATIFAAIILAEIPGPATIAGGLLIVTASLYITLRVGRPAVAAPARAKD